MKNSEKKVLAVAAVFLIYKLLNSRPGIKGYPTQREIIVSNMINSIGSLSFELPDGKLTAAQRKKLLNESLKFKTSNIEMVFKYTKEKSALSQIRSSRDAFNFLKSIYPPNKLDAQEMFAVLYMNQSNRIIAHDVLFIGGVNATIVDARLIIQRAILLLSSAMIVSHNHPSGSNKPSQPDINLTKKLKDALKLVDVNLLDHIIVSDEDRYYSFGDEGMI